MSAYDQAVLIADVEDRLPDPVAREVIKQAETSSAALSLFRRVPMSTRTNRLPVLATLPVAYFVDGDTGLKKTTDTTWDKVTLTAEEVAVIVPIPEAVLDDSNFDVWGEITPLLVEAVGRTIDDAIFFGVNDPASWSGYADIVGNATSAGSHYELGTNAQGSGGVAEDINQLMAMVEADGYDVNGFVAPRTFKARLRGARDTTGQKLLDTSTGTYDGIPIEYAMPGLWGTKQLIAGDFSKGIVAVRQDITYKISTEGVITDDAGEIVYNLFQQDMVAMRIVFRLAFALAKPVTHESGTSGFPFAVLTNNT